MAVRVFIRRHRRGLAFIFGFVGVLIGLASLRQESPTWPALVAARDLPAGHVLTPSDVVAVPVTTSARPVQALTDVEATIGRTLAGPIDGGEILVDRRFVGPGLLADAPAGHVAMTLRLDDITDSAFLRPGDRVDVLAAARGTELAATAAAPATVVARDVVVLAVPGRGQPEGQRLFDGRALSGAMSESGTSLLLAVPDSTAREIAGAAVNARMSVVLHAAERTQSP